MAGDNKTNEPVPLSVVELVRDYQRLLDLERDFEHVDIDDQFISNQDRETLERIVSQALVKCREMIGITL